MLQPFTLQALKYFLNKAKCKAKRGVKREVKGVVDEANHRDIDEGAIESTIEKLTTHN